MSTTSAATHVLYLVRATDILSPRPQSHAEADERYEAARADARNICGFLYEYRNGGIELIKAFQRQTTEVSVEALS